MKRTHGLMWMLLLVLTGMVGHWPHRASAQTQELALSQRRPRFLYAASAMAPPVEIDGTRHAVLRRVIVLKVDQPTIGSLLAEIARQTGLTFAYGDDFPRDRSLQLSADAIPVSVALSGILVDTGVDVVLSPRGRVTLVRRTMWASAMQVGSVVGRVTDAKSTQGIGGVDVSLAGTRWQVTTDGEGRYRLADVAPGSYTVVARRIGYAPERRAVTVAAGQETTLDVVALQPAATRLGDVVVTAQKREERLQDVPLSVAVVTPEEIDRRRLVHAADYLRGIPGVNQTDAQYAQTIVIRGIETQTQFQNFFAGQTTATYFGETPTTNSGTSFGTTSDIKLVDIERVEVLRGPQGTAFGGAAMGGAVRTIPVAPKLDRVEGKLAAGYSATAGTGGDSYDFQGVANLPLIRDKLALRAAGYRYEESGFYRNLAASDPTFQATVVAPYSVEAFAVDAAEVGTSRVTGGRLAALFQASDALKFTLSYLKQKSEVDGFGVATRGTYEQAVLQVAPEHVLGGDTAGGADSDMDLANAMLEYDLGWGNLLASYSYLKSGLEYSEPGTFYGALQPYPQSQAGRLGHRRHTGEIRLATQLDGAWNFLGGLYAEDLDDTYVGDDLLVWHGSPESNIFGPVGRIVLALDSRGGTKQQAAFAEASWEFLPGTTLTGGVRAYHYDRSSGPGSVSGGLVGGATILSPKSSYDASGTSFRGNLSHKLSDNALVYAGWAQGFRLGSPQAQFERGGQCDPDNDGIIDGTNITIEQTRGIDSDEVDNYELGGKLTLLDRRLVIAADIYRMDWSKLPVQIILEGATAPGCLFPRYTENVGAARSEGVEFQANFYVTQGFRVDLGGSYVRARLTRDAPALNIFAGDRLPGSPEINAQLGLQYEFTLGGAPAFVRVDPTYVGPFHSRLPTPHYRAGGYVTVNTSARVALRYLDVDLFVRNLTNLDEFTFRSYAAGVDDRYGYRMRPRTIGLQLSRHF